MFRDKKGKKLGFKETLIKVSARFESIFEEAGIFLLHLTGLVPSHSFRRLVYKLAGISIGKGSTIHCNAKFYSVKNIVIGRDSIIGENAVLDGRAGLKIGDHVDIASEVMIYNSQHNINDPDFKAENKPVVVEDYVFIGPRVIILPGVRIGMGAVVAAGAVVTRDVRERSVVAGVPAQEIGERKIKKFSYVLGRPRLFR